MPYCKNKGFTLIELSMVLVILGLMVGAIVGGKSLVRQAELQGIVKEINGYKTVWNAFKMQYDAWPGDFGEASQYWSGAHNGNASNGIDANVGAIGVWPPVELYYVWEHLSRAELIPGTFTGVPQGSQPYGVIGINLPPSKIKGLSYFVWTPTPLCAGTSDVCAVYGTSGLGKALLNFGRELDAYWPEGGILKAAEVRSIDQKIDDGIPNKGMFLAKRSWEGSAGGGGEIVGCVDQSFRADAGVEVNYILSDTEQNCNMAYWLEY